MKAINVVLCYIFRSLYDCQEIILYADDGRHSKIIDEVLYPLVKNYNLFNNQGIELHTHTAPPPHTHTHTQLIHIIVSNAQGVKYLQPTAYISPVHHKK